MTNWLTYDVDAWHGRRTESWRMWPWPQHVIPTTEFAPSWPLEYRKESDEMNFMFLQPRQWWKCMVILTIIAKCRYGICQHLPHIITSHVSRYTSQYMDGMGDWWLWIQPGRVERIAPCPMVTHPRPRPCLVNAVDKWNNGVVLRTCFSVWFDV